MRYAKKAVAVIMIVSMISGLISGLAPSVYAETLPVNMHVDNYKNGVLDFHWDEVPGTRSVRITYHMPDSSDNAVLNTFTTDQTTNSGTITGLKNDYIYDIYVEIFSDIAGGGEKISEAFLYYIPKITFYSTQIDQQPDFIQGGGREVGHKPALRLSWAMPKVACGGIFTYAHNELDYMEEQIESVYNYGNDIGTLNFRINISSQLSLLNGGSAQSALIIDYNKAKSNYTAYVSGSSDKAADVRAIDANGFMSFDVIGRKDAESELPYIDPDAAENKFKLGDKDILPGTVYYMNIKPVFKDAGSPPSPVNAVTVGLPADQNGSLLSGKTAYTYTPPKFQLSKDSMNNLYIKIFKINQGSLDLPRLYYEVQTTDDPSIPGDWAVKKTLDDTYFQGDFAITVITGINPNNEMHYKIVVKSDGVSDRLESPKMSYILKDDTGRPPVLMGIAITDQKLHAKEVANPQDPQGPGVTVKSTDVTISWEKPANWENIKGDLYFHFLLSTGQTETEKDVPLYIEGEYWGSFPVKYRLVKYISALSPNIKDDGTRISYTIDGFDLFTGEDENRTTEIDNLEKYPDFLLPNTVYYLQMYTTRAIDKGTLDPDHMSNLSLVTSFTTLTDIQRDVPLPVGFALYLNDKITTGTPPATVNHIEVIFNKIGNLDWANYTSKHDPDDKIYYDIYMSSRTEPDSFIKIGTTEVLDGDAEFVGADDFQSPSVRARINSFSEGTPVRAAFGKHLLPNTTYYLIAKTRLIMVNEANPMESCATAILPVTTINLEVLPPDESLKAPLAPADFAISIDEGQNPLITGSSVEFNWLNREPGVKYELICTSGRISPNSDMNDYLNDPLYQSYIAEFDNVDEIEDGRVFLDPGKDPLPAFGKFNYDNLTRLCRYKIDTWLFPNRLYYFSIRAIYISNGNESVWVSIPVTTYLIDAPLALEAVNDCQLGFSFTDSALNMLPEDYSIYLRSPGDRDYKLITRSQSTIVKDNDNKTYYVRLYGLEPDSRYAVKVYKGAGNDILVFQDSSLKTRDTHHEVEIMWTGPPVDDNSWYEIAVMTVGGSEYVTIRASDFEQYISKDGKTLPYYIEETNQTKNSGYVCYHAKIKKMEVVLPGGIVTYTQLSSNMKYYIKVRAVKVDPADKALASYSKYVGPVETRTEFDQDDYDEEDQKEKNKSVFTGKVEDLEMGLFWRVSTDDSSANKVMLRGDRVVNALSRTGNYPLVIDISEFALNIDTDIIYIPGNVIRTMNSEGKSIAVKTSGAEFILRPNFIDMENEAQIDAVLNKTAVRDVLARITIVRTKKTGTVLPAGTSAASNFYDFELQVMGVSRTDSHFGEIVHDRLYDKDSGLVNEKLSNLMNYNFGTGSDSVKLLQQYTDNLVKLIEKDLSIFISAAIEVSRIRGAARDITMFGEPASARIYHFGGQGLKQPHVRYDGTNKWQKIINMSERPDSIVFNISETGVYTVLLIQGQINDVPDVHYAKESIDRFLSKYDLSGVFADIKRSFAPENRVSGKETVLLYEMVMGMAEEHTGLDMKQKVGKTGLDGIISPNNVAKDISRQQAAAVTIKMYSVKTGVNVESLRPGRNIYISDENSIEDKFYKPVLLSIDLGVMTLDSDGSFKPKASITRAEVVTVLVKLLELTGELE